ncbi:MAG TPA: UrcA family protein [Asticcacaulis sp.]|nr:UrcA family protein [Asticcacaulis sp.]
MLRFTAIALVLSSTAFAGAALAGDWRTDPERQPVEEQVSTRNVDFNDPAQVKIVYRKLQYAAERVCHSDRREPGVAEGDAACARDVLAQTVAEIGQPQLTRYAAQMTNSPDRLALNATDTNRR